MGSRSVALGIALTLLAGALEPRATRAGPTPGPDGLATLEQRSTGSSRIGVQTSGALYETSRYRFGASGFELLGPGGRTALIGTRSSATRLISWSEIESIDNYRYHTVRAVVIGAVAGAALGGLVMARAGGPDLFESGDNGGVVLTELLTLSGAGVGLLLGFLTPQRTRIYP